MSWFFKIEPIECPWAPVDVKPERKKPAATTPDGVVFHAGRAFVQSQPEETVFEETFVNSLRSSRIRKGEAESAGLDPVKYAELKTLWASGLSAIMATRQLRGKRGYGLRTLEKYWAAFNAEE